MLNYFKKGKNTTEMQRKMCAVYGEGAGTDRTCQKRFAELRAGDVSRTVLRSWVDQLQVIVISLRHTRNIQINKVLVKVKDVWIS